MDIKKIKTIKKYKSFRDYSWHPFFLFYINCFIDNPILAIVHIYTPLLQSFKFQLIIFFFSSFCFNNINRFLIFLNKEIGIVGGDKSFRIFILNSKRARFLVLKVFCERNYIITIFKKIRKYQFKITISNNFIEN